MYLPCLHHLCVDANKVCWRYEQGGEGADASEMGHGQAQVLAQCELECRVWVDGSNHDLLHLEGWALVRRLECNGVPKHTEPGTIRLC